jgi:ABC-type branched-subunit amino acid transport system substrate-binding protein
MQTAVLAMKAACKNKTADRAEVLRNLRKVKIKRTLLGLPLSFTKNGDNPHAKFYVYLFKGGKRLVG